MKAQGIPKAAVDSYNNNAIQDIYGSIRSDFDCLARDINRTNPDLSAKLKLRGYAVFYNDPRVTLRKGSLYFIGLNPGGHDEDGPYSTDQECVENWTRLSEERGHPYSSYLPDTKNDKWNSWLQGNVSRLIRHLTGDNNDDWPVRATFTANLYFYRTASLSGLREYHRALPKDDPRQQTCLGCWTYHERFLRIVQPRLIICCGNGEHGSAYSHLRSQLVLVSAQDRQEIYRRRFVKGFVAQSPWSKSPVVVLGIHHLSYFWGENGMEPVLKAVDALRKRLDRQLP